MDLSSVQGVSIINNSPNLNFLVGTGNIINNNTITMNYFGPVGVMQESHAIQAKIATALQSRHVPQAVYDAQPGSGCMDGTRVQILRDIKNWINDPKAQQIFWLSGMLGTGKSTIARTICSEANADPDIVLGGSFFCSRSAGLSAQRNVRCVIPTLAQLLARQSTRFSEALADVLDRDPDILHKQITVQVKQLLHQPLLALKDSQAPILFVIDALDECGGQSTSNGTSDDAENHYIISEMLEALVAFSRSALKLPVKFLVTSRPETHIRDTPVSDEAFSTVMRLHTANKEQVAADVRLYISERLLSSSKLRAQFTDNDINLLARFCDGVFIVAAVALHYTLGKGIDIAAMRFERVLNLTGDSMDTDAAGPLDRMYASIILDAAMLEGSESNELQATLQLLATLLSTRMPLSVAALAELLNLPSSHSLRARLIRLHAVVHVPETDDQLGLRTVHASFGDYLFRRAPSSFRVSESLGHDILARACLRTMSRQLHFNISQIPSSYEANPLTRPTNIALSLEYACLHWIYHASGLSEASILDDEIKNTFIPRFLFWLEVMSLLGQVQRSSAILIVAAATVQSTELSCFFRDANSFVETSREAIERSAPRIYISALPFAAKDSVIYKTFIPLCEGLVFVETIGINRHGGRLVMRLTGHEGTVNSIAYSPDSRIITSGSADGTVRIWDTHTGEETMTPLRCGDGSVHSVAFAPNGRNFASGMAGGVVCIWRLLPGQATVRRLCGDSHDVLSVSFSPNGSILASASADIVRLWSVETGQQVATLRGYADAVNAVTFSPDGQTVASGYSDGTIRLWHSATGRPAGQPLYGLDGSVSSLSFSHDGTALASSSSNINLLETQTWRNFATLRASSGSINSVQFSPHGRSLVSTSSDNTVRLWTLEQNATKAFSVILDSCKDGISYATFSPNGLYVATASSDGIIRILEAGNGQEEVVRLPAHNGTVSALVLSIDGTLIASGSDDGSVRVWNARTGEPMFLPLLQNTDAVCSLTISSDSLLLASETADHTVWLWEARTGTYVCGPLHGSMQMDNVSEMSFDAQWIASAANDDTVCIWDVTCRKPSSVGPLGCDSRVTAIAFSRDGHLLAAADLGGRIYLWYPDSGRPFCDPLQLQDRKACSLCFSVDGTQIFANTGHGEVCFLNLGSRQQQTLVFKRHAYGAPSIAYSLDGQLISDSTDSTVRLLEAATRTPIAKMHGHARRHGSDSPVAFMAFTPNGQSVITASGTDETIRVWDVETARSIGSDDARDVITALSTTSLVNGWLLGPAGELLLWVPGEYQHCIQMPPCTVLISRYRVIITADKECSYAGLNWTECWREQATRRKR